MIALAEKYLAQIRSVLDRELREYKAEVYLFGSRARNEARQASDIDLAVKTADAAPSALSKIREALEESTIPFEVDLVDLRDADRAVRSNVEKEGVLVWEN